ncbi:MAG TPA: metal-sensitive transcriptional regulator [Candidatus Acidoferrales bacterium]|nr:metal-sensitive transcriptional regulator [Candidatus Acidoferrales bacterium]
MPRPHALDADLSARLSRAEGQLRGLQRMLGDGAYCIDVLQQLSAARRALDRIALILIRDHLETCVSDAMAEHKAGGKVRELIQTLDRFLS